MPELKASTGSNYIQKKLQEITKNEKLFKLLNVIRELNRHDFDTLLLRYNSISHPVELWQQLYKDIVDKLVKIHVPTIYGKAIQIDMENTVELPLEDRKRFQVLIFDYKNDKLQIVDIKSATEFKEEELLCLLGRHPFKDTKGWSVCNIKFNDKLHEVVGIGQKTWKDRGGDFDGDAALVILMKLPSTLDQQLRPPIEKSKYETNEAITLPKKVSKATINVELNEIQIPSFEFTYCKNGKCLIYPETISHIQNLENLTGAILMAINIASGFKTRWNKKQLMENTEQIKKIVAQELEKLQQTDYRKYETYSTIINNIHPTFMYILTPLVMINDIDIELYSAILRVFIKDKGPALYGYLQKVLLSVAETKEEIKRVLDFIDAKQQSVIDLKKAEHSLLNYNEALKSKSSEYLAESEISDLYKKWKKVDTNWSKNKWKLLFYEIEYDELDKLISTIRKICLE